ncbi:MULTISPECIES: response regulator [Streptomyces]|uniref:response regulator n=1 Tax=Streptomyces TaxID=1883 RepID=UPI00226F58F3|nr:MULTISPECIES: response regulator transcription factor [unclassified Streptomyces]MCY0947429.1 response regulator transcription factor [Streptomyces sp. H34-AA3]MCY0950086.1 response regulator transcription factor [Streptomyces sp. H27-S2]MCZ4088316.1 response regulator transcription factor [Streptomyces sp. H34-S5]
MPSVLVVDDQFLIRSGLAALLTAAVGYEVAGQAADGEEAVRLAERTRPDVVLMDVRMPGTDGIAATERILAGPEPGRPKVLILTTFDSDEYVFRSLRAGASGFLLKDTPPERLLAAISTVHAGDMLFSPRALRGLIDTYAAPVTRAPHAGLDTLTPREREVLGLVGAGLSNADIAGRLALSAATVKTHVHRCMSKLELSSRAQAVVMAYEFGLAARRP